MKNLKKTAFVMTVLSVVIFFGSLEDVNAQRRSQRQGGMEWRGTVDDRIQIVIRGRNARIQHISGQETFDANYNFWSQLPRRDVTVSVRKRDGRGEVFVVQQPNRRNNYTAIIQISDRKARSDRYRLEVTWY